MYDLLRIVDGALPPLPELLLTTVALLGCLLWLLRVAVAQATGLILAVRHLLRALKGLRRDIKRARSAIRRRSDV
jgi:hypothetical protein